MRGWSTSVTATAATALVAAAMLTAPAAAAGSRAASVPRPAEVGGHRVAATAGDISTVAGGVGGPGKATSVAVGAPCGVAFSGGYLYAGNAITDVTTVRQVSLSNDQLTTPVGVGALGPLGDGGPATKASLSAACGLAFDHFGNLVITDYSHAQVRVVAASTGTFYGQAMTAGRIYSVAGSGATGFAGDGGPATSAHLNGPYGVAVDAAGNLVIADYGNRRIRVVAARTGTFYGVAMTAGDIYTVAGGGTGGLGGPATKARIANPGSVAADPAGNLLIGDGSTGVLTVAASTGTFYGVAMTAGDIYRVAGGGSGGLGDGGPATSARLGASAVTTDGAGNLVIGDGFYSRVRVVAASTGTFYGQAMTAGDIYTIAGGGTGGLGDGGPATSAELVAPEGVAFDSAGNLLIADSNHNRVRVVAASTGTFYGQAMTAGDIYTVAGNGYPTYSGHGIPATKAELYGYAGAAGIEAAVSVDAAGNVLIADCGNNLVRVTAASSGTFYGQAMTAGDIYTIAGNGTAGFAGNTGLASKAELKGPTGVAADAAGDLLIADQLNNRIRIVAASTGTLYGQAMIAGHIYTLAGGGTMSGNGVPATQVTLRRPAGVAVDGAGNVLIAGNQSNKVYVVAARNGTFYGQAMTAGDIYTLAGNGTGAFSGDGGPATSAELRDPYGVAVDGPGNVLIAASGNNRVRVVAASTGTFYGQAMTAGDIYTIAGGGTSLGSGGPATSAELGAPDGVAVDGAGNVLIADTGDNRVRVAAASSGTFYGHAMTAGDIYTVVGNGTAGFFGDGGAGTSAWLSQPSGVAMDGTNLLIADSGSNRIREVTG